MDAIIPVLFVAVFVILLCAIMWHMFSGEVVGTVEAARRSVFGRTSARVTVRRVGSDRASTARLQAGTPFGYRGIGLSKVNAARCADLLDRCAKDGRVTEGAAGARAGGVEIAPDFDEEEGRAVALLFPRESESVDIRLLLTPHQANTVARWLRIALAPGGTLAQARRNARIAEERRAALGGP